VSIVAVRIKHALEVPVQCCHDADPRELRWPVIFYNQQQRFHRCLPFFGIVLCLGQFGDVGTGVLQRGELATAPQRDRIVEAPLPSFVWLQ